MIVDLLPGSIVSVSTRKDAIQPAGAKRSDVRHVLDVAATHAIELTELWEKTHGVRP